MKKIICLGLFALLAISFGCSKDEILTEQENSKLEQKTITESENGQKGEVIGTQPSNATQTTIPLPGSDANIYYLYLNMDAIENSYNNDPNNPSYTGPFNIFYRNLMSTHFSIYFVHESNNSGCGNVERWIVNLDELNQYLVSIGLPEVNPDEDDWYQLLADPPGNTSSTLHFVDGTPAKRPPPPPPPPTWLVNAYNCFTL